MGRRTEKGEGEGGADLGESSDCFLMIFECQTTCRLASVASNLTMLGLKEHG